MDRNEPAKRGQALAWLRRLKRSDRLITSAQALNETYWVLRRKRRFGIGVGEARDYVRSFRPWAAIGMDPIELQNGGWFVEDRYGLAFYDAMLVATAVRIGCVYFLSEDLNDGQSYAGVVALNPFRHAPEDVLGRTV